MSPADEAPATAGMLRHLRTELVHRIEQGDNQLRDDMRQMKGELRDEMRQMKEELLQRIEQGDNQLRDQLLQYGIGLAAVRNDLLGLRADMARVLYLAEEQNVRNRIVLEGLTGLAARQDRVERRMDAVEETVRDLASSRRP